MDHYESLRRQLERLCFRHLELDPSRPLDFPDGRELPDLMESACGRAVEDLEAYVAADPTLMGEARYALVPNSPFMATLSYRLSHLLWSRGGDLRSRQLAVEISHRARVLTGAEIHPAARIGRRFILDHGTNTVIGATAQIGDSCYVLNGVILGARGISDNPSGKRHPTIGNRVQIGAFARILGDIRVGDDVFIAPLACVTRDIPDGTHVGGPVSGMQIRRHGIIADAV
ncbi:MAG: serine O-acetyltransferase [Salinarimonas sp.]